MAEVVQQLDPYDLTIWQGKSWALDLALTAPDPDNPGEQIAISLEGYEGRGQIRAFPGGDLFADFVVNVDSENGGVALSLSPDDTRRVVRRGVYDVELVSGSQVVGILHGDVAVIPEVTVP